MILFLKQGLRITTPEHGPEGASGGFCLSFRKFVSIMEVIAPISKYNLNEAEEKKKSSGTIAVY
jgi:hypothetical protein